MGIRITKEPWWIRHRTLGITVGYLMITIVIPIYFLLVCIETVWVHFTGNEVEKDKWGDTGDYEIGNQD